jgi:hypothetical protein
MMRASRIVALLALLVASPAFAKDMGSLYDDATLGHWQERYQEGILWNVENVIWPRLSAQERQRLAGVNLCFPLRGRPAIRSSSTPASGRPMTPARR